MERKFELKAIITGNYLYNLEHCIHHQALIKVAVLQCENIINR